MNATQPPRVIETKRRTVMKAGLFLFGVLIATTAIGTTAQAQNYPWCAYYGNGNQGTNCGFVSFAQCQADVSGIGGFCQPNNTYHPPTGPHKHRIRS
jgi:hypothetical protein